MSKEANKVGNPPTVLTPVEAAWFAGVLDASGTLTLRMHNCLKFPTVELSVRDTDNVFINRVRSLSGLGKAWPQKPTQGRLNVKTLWWWRSFGPDCYFLLKLVQPYLISNKLKATLLIRWIELTQEPLKSRPLKVRQELAETFNTLRRLNSRGAHCKWMMDESTGELIDVSEEVGNRHTRAGLL